MNYDEALEEWGRRKILEVYPKHNKNKVVSVSFELDEGYACCGGQNPECYCSFAESPYAFVLISSGGHEVRIGSYAFDIASMVMELTDIVNEGIDND